MLDLDLDLIFTFAPVVEVVWVIGLAGWILLERRTPVATLAWIFALAWLPAIGIAVYYFFGPRRLARRKLRRTASRALVRAAVGAIRADTEDVQFAQLAELVVRAGDAAPLRAVRLDLFTEGDECYDAIVADIRAATHHVHVAYYIFDGDHTGTRIRDALIERAKAGVEVRLLLDGIGAYSLTRRFLAPLRAAGARVEWFNPVTLSRLRPRLANFRTHRKIVICDGTVGYTGGMNVADCHSALRSGPRAWRDTHLRIAGQAVRTLQRVFLEDWHYACGSAPVTPEYLPPPGEPGERFVQIVASGPDQDVYSIHKLFFAAIASAKQRVLITTPYFVPDEPIVSALVTAALRGVDVRVLIPAEGDSRLVDWASRSYLPELLSAGVRIWEYLPRFLHAKTMVVDYELGIVGTANFDNRSFRLNFEVVAAAYDAELTTRLATAFHDDLGRAREITPRSLARRPVWDRLGESAARLLSPLL